MKAPEIRGKMEDGSPSISIGGEVKGVGVAVEIGKEGATATAGIGVASVSVGSDGLGLGLGPVSIEGVKPGGGWDGSKVTINLGIAKISTEQRGCTIITTEEYFSLTQGKIVFVTEHQAENCSTPTPTPAPTPSETQIDTGKSPTGIQDLGNSLYPSGGYYCRITIVYNNYLIDIIPKSASDLGNYMSADIITRNSVNSQIFNYFSPFDGYAAGRGRLETVDRRVRELMNIGYIAKWDTIVLDSSVSCTPPLPSPSPSPSPSLPFNPPPKTMSNCCDATQANLRLTREIHQVLECKKVLDSGFEYPNRIRVTEGSGTSKLKTYPKILSAMIQTMDFLGVHPFTAIIKDANPAIKGDQPVTAKIPNATMAAKFMAEKLMQAEGRSVTEMYLLKRTAIAVGQSMLILMEVLRTVQVILFGLGIPFKDKLMKIAMPFDMKTDGTDPEKNGFAKKKKPKIDENTQNLEDLELEEFMQTSNQLFEGPVYTHEDKTLWYYVARIFNRG